MAGDPEPIDPAEKESGGLQVNKCVICDAPARYRWQDEWYCGDCAPPFAEEEEEGQP